LLLPPLLDRLAVLLLLLLPDQLRHGTTSLPL
jgi:hypothetical protein